MTRLSILACCALSLIVASCASVVRHYPDLDESRVKDVVAVVQIHDGRYLEDLRECGETQEGEIVICMDPPPFVVRADITQQLFGPRLPPTIEFVSTSHYGIPRVRSDEALLVHLRTDGKSIVMPRYHGLRVGEDVWGELSVPAQPEEIWWLPCGTNALAKRVQFQFPQGAFAEPRDWVSDESLAEHPDFYFVSNRSVRPRLAIPIDSLEAFLKERRPSGEDAFHCDEQH